MASNTNISFTDFQTIIPASWANYVNNFVNYFPVTNIANLRTTLKTNISQVVVLGYYTPFDGGGGIYVYDPTDVSSSDNGGTIIVGTDGGRWKLQIIGPVSLKQFGAVFNGSSDDTAEIQAAFNWLASVGGGTLYAPQGTSIINSGGTSLLTWPSSTTTLRLQGAGREATFFQCTNTGNAAIFNITTGTGFELSDLSLSGPNTPATSGFLLTDAIDHKFTRVGFLRYFNAANMSANVGIFDNCGFGAEGVNGPISTSSRGVVVNGYAGGLNITNCVGYVPAAPTITPFCGIELQNCGAVQITGCNIIRQGTNVLVNPQSGQTVASLMISNCYLDSAQNYNLQLAPGTGGSVVRTFITQTECSSALASGIQIDGSLGTVDGVLIVSSQANFCGVNGITVTGSGAKNIDLVGGEHTGNVGAGLSFNNGCFARATAVFSGTGYGGGFNATGFFVDGTSNVVLRNCTATGNSTNYAVSSTTTVQDCSGFVSENTGVGTIGSGGTTVTISHGLSGVPNAAQIQITPFISTGSNPMLVNSGSVGATTFQVQTASATSGTYTFGWRATCNGRQ